MQIYVNLTEYCGHTYIASYQIIDYEAHSTYGFLATNKLKTFNYNIHRIERMF